MKNSFLTEKELRLKFDAANVDQFALLPYVFHKLGLQFENLVHFCIDLSFHESEIRTLLQKC